MSNEHSNVGLNDDGAAAGPVVPYRSDAVDRRGELGAHPAKPSQPVEGSVVYPPPATPAEAQPLHAAHDHGHHHGHRRHDHTHEHVPGPREQKLNDRKLRREELEDASTERALRAKERKNMLTDQDDALEAKGLSSQSVKEKESSSNLSLVGFIATLVAFLLFFPLMAAAPLVIAAFAVVGGAFAANAIVKRADAREESEQIERERTKIAAEYKDARDARRDLQGGDISPEELQQAREADARERALGGHGGHFHPHPPAPGPHGPGEFAAASGGGGAPLPAAAPRVGHGITPARGGAVPGAAFGGGGFAPVPAADSARDGDGTVPRAAFGGGVAPAPAVAPVSYPPASANAQDVKVAACYRAIHDGAPSRVGRAPQETTHFASNVVAILAARGIIYPADEKTVAGGLYSHLKGDDMKFSAKGWNGEARVLFAQEIVARAEAARPEGQYLGVDAVKAAANGAHGIVFGGRQQPEATPAAHQPQAATRIGGAGGAGGGLEEELSDSPHRHSAGGGGARGVDPNAAAAASGGGGTRGEFPAYPPLHSDDVEPMPSPTAATVLPVHADEQGETPSNGGGVVAAAGAVRRAEGENPPPPPASPPPGYDDAVSQGGQVVPATVLRVSPQATNAADQQPGGDVDPLNGGGAAAAEAEASGAGARVPASPPAAETGNEAKTAAPLPPTAAAQDRQQQPGGGAGAGEREALLGSSSQPSSAQLSPSLSGAEDVPAPPAVVEGGDGVKKSGPPEGVPKFRPAARRGDGPIQNPPTSRPAPAAAAPDLHQQQPGGGAGAGEREALLGSGQPSSAQISPRRSPVAEDASASQAVAGGSGVQSSGRPPAPKVRPPAKAEGYTGESHNPPTSRPPLAPVQADAPDLQQQLGSGAEAAASGGGGVAPTSSSLVVTPAETLSGRTSIDEPDVVAETRGGGVPSEAPSPSATPSNKEGLYGGVSELTPAGSGAAEAAAAPAQQPVTRAVAVRGGQQHPLGSVVGEGDAVAFTVDPAVAQALMLADAQRREYYNPAPAMGIGSNGLVVNGLPVPATLQEGHAEGSSALAIGGGAAPAPQQSGVDEEVSPTRVLDGGQLAVRRAQAAEKMQGRVNEARASEAFNTWRTNTDADAKVTERKEKALEGVGSLFDEETPAPAAAAVHADSDASLDSGDEKNSGTPSVEHQRAQTARVAGGDRGGDAQVPGTGTKTPEPRQFIPFERNGAAAAASGAEGAASPVPQQPDGLGEKDVRLAEIRSKVTESLVQVLARYEGNFGNGTRGYDELSLKRVLTCPTDESLVLKRNGVLAKQSDAYGVKGIIGLTEKDAGQFIADIGGKEAADKWFKSVQFSGHKKVSARVSAMREKSEEYGKRHSASQVRFNDSLAGSSAAAGTSSGDDGTLSNTPPPAKVLPEAMAAALEAATVIPPGTVAQRKSAIEGQAGGAVAADRTEEGSEKGLGSQNSSPVSSARPLGLAEGSDGTQSPKSEEGAVGEQPLPGTAAAPVPQAVAAASGGGGTPPAADEQPVAPIKAVASASEVVPGGDAAALSSADGGVVPGENKAAAPPLSRLQGTAGTVGGDGRHP